MISKIWNSLDDGMKRLIKILGILLVVFIIGMIILSLIGGNKNMNYQAIEDVITDATKKYAEDLDKMPSKDTKIVINSSSLIEKGYMKSWEKYTNDKCDASVTIENNNGLYNYITILNCNNYKTKTLKDAIKEDLVTSGDGLYENGDGTYLYKGEYPNNYITIDNIMYRIVGMDNDNIKLVYYGDRNLYSIFDNRYNRDSNSNIGINDYSVSRLMENIKSRYNELSDNARRLILNSSWCVEKYNSTTGSFMCNSYFDDYLFLLSLKDITQQSLDSYCDGINSKNCANYNYLYSFVQESLSITTPVENSYEVYLLSLGLYKDQTNRSNEYYYIMNINANNIVGGGNGSSINPYTVK